jgi:hypothetical protein
MNKYYNKKARTADGEVHDSLKEARRWSELLLLERAGVISNLRRQVKYVLIPRQDETFARYGKDGKRLKDGTRTIERECSYIADFVYEKDGEEVVEDVKGYKRGGAYELFSCKRKLMLFRHGIRVSEV